MSKRQYRLSLNIEELHMIDVALDFYRMVCDDPQRLPIGELVALESRVEAMRRNAEQLEPI